MKNELTSVTRKKPQHFPIDDLWCPSYQTHLNAAFIRGPGELSPEEYRKKIEMLEESAEVERRRLNV
jgi:hypothetical protein